MAGKKRKVPDSGAMGLDVDQWLRDLLAVKQNGSGLTMREWTERLGVSERKALDMLKRADAVGKVVRGTKVVMRFDGRPFTTVTYEVVK